MILTNSIYVYNDDVGFLLHEDDVEGFEELIKKELGARVGGSYEDPRGLTDSLRLWTIDREINEDLLKKIFDIDFQNAVNLKGTSEFREKLDKTRNIWLERACIDLYNIGMQVQDLIYSIDHGLTFLNEETRCLESIQGAKKYADKFDIRKDEGKRKFNELKSLLNI